MEEYSIRNQKIDFIINEVCDDFFVTREAVLSSNRKREIALCRKACMLMAHEFKTTKTEYSMQTIGNHLGGKDHSTVTHALESIKDLMFFDKLLKRKIQDLRVKLSLALNIKGYEEQTREEFKQESSFETPDENTFKFLIKK